MLGGSAPGERLRWDGGRKKERGSGGGGPRGIHLRAPTAGRALGEGSAPTGGKGVGWGVPPAAHRMVGPPHEDAEQRLRSPEQLHLLAHEMFLLGLGFAGAECRAQCRSAAPRRRSPRAIRGHGGLRTAPQSPPPPALPYQRLRMAPPGPAHAPPLSAVPAASVTPGAGSAAPLPARSPRGGCSVPASLPPLSPPLRWFAPPPAERSGAALRRRQDGGRRRRRGRGGATAAPHGGEPGECRGGSAAPSAGSPRHSVQRGGKKRNAARAASGTGWSGGQKGRERGNKGTSLPLCAEMVSPTPCDVAARATPPSERANKRRGGWNYEWAAEHVIAAS